MTTIPAVKAALVTILTAALPNTQVVYGPGTSVTLLKQRFLIVGESVTGQLTPTAMNNSTGTEQYTVDMLAVVSIPGTNAALADTQVLADFAAAIAAIQADSHLGGLNLNASVDGTFEMVPIDNEAGRACSIRFPVSVFAVS
jgi:hypothetical protein